MLLASEVSISSAQLISTIINTKCCNSHTKTMQHCKGNYVKCFSENNENLQKLENLSDLKLATTPICCLFSSYFGRWKYLPTLILVSLRPGMFQANFSELSFAVFAAYFWDILVEVILLGFFALSRRLMFMARHVIQKKLPPAHVPATSSVIDDCVEISARAIHCLW